MEKERLIKVTRYMSGMSIADYYKGKVKQISIKYNTTFIWFAGIKEESHSFTKNKTDAADFYIDCPNLECTESYFDLRDEVNSLYRSKGETTKGEKVCKGKVAPDHPNQRCETTMTYEIEITYSK